VTVAIQCREVSKEFGQIKAVDRANLSLTEGKFLALLGPSGCGKTTTLRLLAGFEPADSGTIDIGAKRVFGPGVFVPPEQRSVGMVFQEYALFPHLNVADNVAYGIPKGIDKEERVAEVLALVGLPDMHRRMPFELSGGQQQRIALARALAPRPQLVLLDEPFSNLDAGLRGQLRGEVRQILRQAQATVIFVTHDQEEALSLADEIAVMIDGKIVQVATPQQLYRNPVNKEVATFLGNTNFLPGQAVNGRVSCELGEFPFENSKTGEVTVMLRPETIGLTESAAGNAKVVAVEYYGHDQLVTVSLSSGSLVRCRLLGTAGDFTAGQNVALEINDEIVVYPNQV
jgi:iron(III) transport system ATP-binding protein